MDNRQDAEKIVDYYIYQGIGNYADREEAISRITVVLDKYDHAIKTKERSLTRC